MTSEFVMSVDYRVEQVKQVPCLIISKGLKFYGLRCEIVWTYLIVCAVCKSVFGYDLSGQIYRLNRL